MFKAMDCSCQALVVRTHLAYSHFEAECCEQQEKSFFALWYHLIRPSPNSSSAHFLKIGLNVASFIPAEKKMPSSIWLGDLFTP